MNTLLSKLENMEQNNKIVLKNTVFAFLIKGGGLMISLLSTPAFIRYFSDNTVLGVWYTLLSVLTWFLNFDLGLGNGIRNNLVKAFTAGDRKAARSIISSGFFAVGVVTVGLSVVGVVLLSTLNLNKFFNISVNSISQEALLLSAILVFFAIMVRFLLTTVSAIFYSAQMSAVNSFLGLCVSIFQLIFVLFVKFDNAETGLVALSAAYLVISNLPVAVAGIIVFCTKLKDCRPGIQYIKRNYIQIVMRVGGVFFVCQILYMLIVNTNELLITNLFSPRYTTEYTFYYKITSLVSMVITLAMTPIWSVVTKAMAENNWDWLYGLYKKIKIVGYLVVAMEFILIPFLQFIMDIWLGGESIEINYKTAVAFACFGSVFVYSGMLSTIVCGMARMKLQTICYSCGVVFKFVFVIVLSKIVNDWSIVVWSNAILLFPYCVLQQMDLNRFIKSKLKT